MTSADMLAQIAEQANGCDVGLYYDHTTSAWVVWISDPVTRDDLAQDPNIHVAIRKAHAVMEAEHGPKEV